VCVVRSNGGWNLVWTRDSVDTKQMVAGKQKMAAREATTGRRKTRRVCG
jgi:hypothetical protein